jgi:nicotinate-nucleotide--dimethylbenzimidazole phosphoribosyltransferase
MKKQFEAALAAVRPVDQALAAVAQAHLDDLTKPRGSLGRLEEAALKLFLIQERAPLAVDPAVIHVVAGDHGVAAEGVSLFPSEVTRQMVLNFVHGGAAINVLARTAGVGLKVVDAGVAGGPFDPAPGLVNGKVAPGTANLAQGVAMTGDQCLAALLLGVGLAREAADGGARAVGTGDMGIANTTPSTALYCAFLGLSPREVTGPGTGLDANGVSHKARVIEGALALHRAVIDSGDPLAILAALGGYEIACLAGLIIGAAGRRMAVAVDGFISTAAYLCAARLCPAVADYCFLSHLSAETGHAAVLSAMGARPLLHLDMRLGEGTGGALALFLLRAAANVYNDMATFSSAGVTDSK